MLMALRVVHVSLLNRFHQGHEVLTQDRKTVGQPIKVVKAEELDLTM